MAVLSLEAESFLFNDFSPSLLLQPSADWTWPTHAMDSHLPAPEFVAINAKHILKKQTKSSQAGCSASTCNLRALGG